MSCAGGISIEYQQEMLSWRNRKKISTVFCLKNITSSGAMMNDISCGKTNESQQKKKDLQDKDLSQNYFCPLTVTETLDTAEYNHSLVSLFTVRI